MTAGDASVILLYHGVTNVASEGIENFSGKHISAAVFDEQMRYVAERCHPVTLREMAARLAAGEPLPRRSVAVTFDDAFKNNRDVALPILRRHGVPATFFITTGFVGTQRRFWVDVVEHVVNASEEPAVDLELDGEPRRFHLTTPAERVDAVVTIKRAMKSMTPAARDTTLAALRAATAVTGEPVAANYRNLTWDDVRDLDHPPHYEVGGHTVNHEILSYLDDERLAHEVGHCLATLEAELGHPVDLFSYPEGQAHHYDERVIEELRRRGVTVCPSAMDGVNHPGASPFHLRRIMVGFMGAPFPFDLAEAEARPC